ncbi:Zinc finger CCCH domain-containing protein 38 [Quillaja saponaria]|nr:Zinc finger CCCH domain-containing protein 38 [Quillaja saponaria]
MSGSGRRRSSKWDLRDDPEFASEHLQFQSGWSYFEGNDKPNSRHDFRTKEPFSEGRVTHKNDITNKDCSRRLDATMAWDGDASYGTRMSPGLEEWKHSSHSQSPRNGWGRSFRSRSRSRSRSWSRSPVRGPRRDSAVHDRMRSRSGGAAPVCRDFAAGKCRRGTNCHFLHHGNENNEDTRESRHRKEEAPRYTAPLDSRDCSTRSGRSYESCINFSRGKCQMGASCKYIHHSNSDGFSKGSVDESTREREYERRNRDNSFDRASEHDPQRSVKAPCKFFATGNCRNGKYCRFSHDSQALVSPNGRSRDERRRPNSGEDQVQDSAKWRGTVSPDRRSIDDRLDRDCNTYELDKTWDGPTWDDVSVNAKMCEDKNENMNAPEPGLAALPLSDGWGHTLDNKNKVHGDPVDTEKKKGNQRKAESAGASLESPESKVTETWLGDDMSPDWNYRVESANLVKEEHSQNKQGITQSEIYMATMEHDRNQTRSGQGFNQNGQSLSALQPSSLPAVGQSQVTIPVVRPRGIILDGLENQAGSIELQSGIQPNNVHANPPPSQVNVRIPPTQDAVSNEQLVQLTNFSASLAQFLGTGQHLPQLYAALNSQDAQNAPSFAKHEGSLKPVSTPSIKSDAAIGLQKQYDPICDSIEPKKTDEDGMPPVFSSNTVGQKRIEEKPESPSQLSSSDKQNCGDYHRTGNLEEHTGNTEQLSQLQQVDNRGPIKDNDGVVAEESKLAQDDKKNKKENGPLENMDVDGGNDEGKKIKDVKGIRAFKFSLAEFVKELLKPTWKEGKITKEDYKTIVKKVVDKVTSTVQGAHIPQTQEKIDHYLSFSKPKLNKLVQAYVEKAQKA